MDTRRDVGACPTLPALDRGALAAPAPIQPPASVFPLSRNSLGVLKER